MKKHLFLLSTLLLAAAFGPHAYAGEEEIVRFTERPYVERGMTRETVRNLLGEASARLTADVWVYLDFHASNYVASRVQTSVGTAAKPDALLVIFQADRVSLLRWCEGARAQALIAQHQHRNNLPGIVAAK